MQADTGIPGDENPVSQQVSPAADPAFVLRSDRAYYLLMRDRVRLAVNLYFPGHVAPERPVTTILALTRYGRAGAVRDPRFSALLGRGCVLAAIDTRGSTASFGHRHTELGPQQIADTDEIIAHLVGQPWSNGKVIAIGQSYLADTADVATSRPVAGLAGAIVMQADFDVFALFFPGGVTNRGFIDDWGALTHQLDLGRTRSAEGFDGRLRREDIPALYPDLQPVDDDPDCSLVHAALQDKQRWLPQDWRGVSFRDDRGSNGHVLFESSPAAQLEGIRREAKPVQYWGSWMDAGTADGALARFRSAPEVPMEIWLTANDHGNFTGCDPLRPESRAPAPSPEEMLAIQARFLAAIEAGEPIESLIHYYVMGAGAFRSTACWPPAGVEKRLFHFTQGGRLAPEPGNEGVVSKDMDLNASTGPASRWTGQTGGPPADYPDRADADAALLTFDSDPVEADMELVGTPVVAIEMASLSSDPALFVYLEDVSPDGRVTLLTEGQFRAIHRRPADPASLPYDQGPAPHSFLRADRLEVSSGERIRVAFALGSLAARIARGHRVRIAIAAADAHMFQTYSNGGPERFDIFVGGACGSTATLPFRPWDFTV